MSLLKIGKYVGVYQVIQLQGEFLQPNKLCKTVKQKSTLKTGIHTSS